MNRSEASRLAQTATLDDLRAMFKAAQEGITDWTAASRANSQISRGAAFNILAAGFAAASGINGTSNRNCLLVIMCNCIWEFGEYLPGYKKPDKRRSPKLQPLHREPNFIGFGQD